MHEFNILTAALGGLVLFLALGSDRLAASPLPPTLLALLLGILFGPRVFGLIQLPAADEMAVVLEGAARLTLGIGLVGVALRIPPDYPRREWRAMALLLGLGMPLMWATGTLLVYLVLGLPFWLSALIGAILSPTDPVVASQIVSGTLAERNVPPWVRHALSFESGINDGFGFPFVLLPLLMLTMPAGDALSRWLLHTLLWEVVGGALVGLLIGHAAGRLLHFSWRRGQVGTKWRLAYTVALALLAVGIGKLIGSDELLVVFAAGAAFAQVAEPPERAHAHRLQETVNLFFSTPMFALLGIAIPWEGWSALGWNGLALVIAILLLRRIPVLLLLRPLLPGLHGMMEALFVGWFGPMAVGAIYYAALAWQRLGQPLAWHVVSLVVCGSVVAHGMSGASLTRLLGRVWRRPGQRC